MNSMLIIEKARLLPEEWNHLAGKNIFLRKENLVKLEEVNPCGQNYYMFCNPEPSSIVVTYSLKCNIFTYGFVTCRVPVTIVGIPCSVSKQGYHLGEKTKDEVFKFLSEIKGPKILLNIDKPPSRKGFALGETLPSCQLDIRWKSMEGYLKAMRSHYRYRLNRAIDKWQKVQRIELSNQELFDDNLYKLYLQVYNKSNYKLERLSIDFFKTFPSRIIKFEDRGRALGFIQLVENKEELIFLLGGFDYPLNFEYDIYINMLLEIVKMGIDGGYKTIDLGQTAEDTKMKLGGIRKKKYMVIHHSNKMINYFVGKFPGLLSYDPKNIHFNVFKGEK